MMLLTFDPKRPRAAKTRARTTTPNDAQLAALIEQIQTIRQHNAHDFRLVQFFVNHLHGKIAWTDGHDEDDD